MLLVGISGKAGTGKSTLASNLNCPVMSFADALREEVAAFLNITVQDTKERKAEVVLGKTIREWLQSYGAEKRAKNPGYWVKRMKAKLDEYNGQVVAIDDVRYPNEAMMVMESRPSILIRLEPYSSWQPIAPDHESETALDKWPAWDLRLSPPLGWLPRLGEQLQGLITRRMCRWQ